MLNRLTLVFVFVFAASASTLFAQDGRLLEQRFDQADQNGDGVLTREEVPNVAWFDRSDADNDGTLTKDEARNGLRNVGRSGESSNDEPDFSTDLAVAYGELDAQRLDVYSPREVSGAPVMLYVHGGGWRAGDRSRVGLKPQFFTDEGWVFLSISYRLIPGGEHPRNVEDVALAIAWTCEHVEEYGGDPEKIFIMGHSAGCHLVSLVATDQRRLEKAGRSLSDVKGVIGLDTQAYDIPNLIAGPAGSETYRKVFSEDPEIQRDASPMHHVEEGKGIPPFLVCYSSGMTRFVSPYRSKISESFATALRDAGVEAEAVDATDRNHGAINQRFGDPEDEKVTPRAMRFMNAILEGVE
jgi:arylformamidase